MSRRNHSRSRPVAKQPSPFLRHREAYDQKRATVLVKSNRLRYNVRKRIPLLLSCRGFCDTGGAGIVRKALAGGEGRVLPALFAPAARRAGSRKGTAKLTARASYFSGMIRHPALFLPLRTPTPGNDGDQNLIGDRTVTPDRSGTPTSRTAFTAPERTHFSNDKPQKRRRAGVTELRTSWKHNASARGVPMLPNEVTMG